VRRVLLSGIAIGLFVGTKPTALLGAALLLAALTFRARRERVLLAAVPAAVIAIVLGTETYVVNVIRHGNPIWPVRLDVGPVHLPAKHAMSELLASGAKTPQTHGSLAARVFTSWTTLYPPVPAFDMRVGGLGLVFLVALPFAVARAVRSRSIPLALVAAAS